MVWGIICHQNVNMQRDRWLDNNLEPIFNFVSNIIMKERETLLVFLFLSQYDIIEP